MNDVRAETGQGGALLLWIARLASLATNSVFLLILVLALTNEDRPQGAAIPVLVFLVLAMLSCFVAWRWERAGGLVVLASALGLGVVVYAALPTYGLGAQFLPPLLYAVPYLLVGALFLFAARGQR